MALSRTQSSGGGQYLNESPMITIAGEVTSFILDTMAGHITNDLAREPSDWYRSTFDNAISVYLGANLIELNEAKHLLPLEGNVEVASSSSSSSTTPSNNQAASLSMAQQQSVRRHSSLTAARRPLSLRPNRVDGDLSLPYFPDEQQQQQQPHHGSQHPTAACNVPLYRVITQRHLACGSSRVLLNTFWLDACPDLEVYNQRCRQPLLEWFGKVLANSLVLAQIEGRLAQGKFTLDCCVVLMAQDVHAQKNKKPADEAGAKPKGHADEQPLSLHNLISSSGAPVPEAANIAKPAPPAKSSMFKGFSVGNRFLKSSASTLGTNSSRNSLRGNALNRTNSNSSGAINSLGVVGGGGGAGGNSTAGGHPASSLMASGASFNLGQLAEQIRNDMLVSFQLFQQKYLPHLGNEAVLMGRINQQLIESIIVFDHKSAGGQTTGGGAGATTTPSTPSAASQPSATKSAFSSLGFTSSAIKITSSPLKPNGSPLPSRVGKFYLGSGGQGAGGIPLVPIVLNYSSFIARLREILLAAYSRQCETYERLVREQRELRARPEWDYFAFFLLQEELALAYENLGLYDWALAKYDDLEKLFGQLVLEAGDRLGSMSHNWLLRRLVDQVDDENDNLTEGIGPLAMSSSSSSSLYNSWHGLCLCNVDVTSELRQKIIQCVKVQVLPNDADEFDGRGAASSRAVANTGNFIDPLGVRVAGTSSGSVSQRSPIPPLGVLGRGQISLINFRNYLFARQCHLLCLMNKPWELASRALPFLQTTVNELAVLDISIAPGGIACWVFLSVLEILYKCERYSDSSQLESYSYHTVGLWSYARDKLVELGRLCQLAPTRARETMHTLAASRSLEPSSPVVAGDASRHLHRMVELVAGMGADPHVARRVRDNELVSMSPQERLKEALASPDAFFKQYLELTELTMGTYKHIGYTRTPRLIGKELAEVYLLLRRPQQALPFLLDFYQMFQAECWTYLKKKAAHLLAECLEQLYVQAFTNIDGAADNLEGGCSFNLEATARSAFRTYLLLLLKSSTLVSFETISCSSRKDGPDRVAKEEAQQAQFREALCRVLQHYRKHGTTMKDIVDRLKLALSFDEAATETSARNIQQLWLACGHRPLLAIHNTHSDFFQDPNKGQQLARKLKDATDSSANKLSTSNDSSLNVSAESLNTSQGSLGSRASSGSATSMPNFASGANCNEQFVTLQGFEVVDEVDGEIGKRLQTPTITSGGGGGGGGQEMSFIAGSKLKLKLTLVSHLTVELDVEHLFATLELSLQPQYESMVAGGRKASVAASLRQGAGGAGTESIMVLDLEPMERGIRVANADRLLRKVDHLNNGSKFWPQLTISLLNQKLADDHINFKHYRFLGARHKFVNNSREAVKLRPGANQFVLTFEAPRNLEHEAALLFQEKAANNVSQLWFRFDQLVLHCRLPPNKADDGVDVADFVLAENFLQFQSSLQASFAFRLVKCPPMIELIPEAEEETAGQKSKPWSKMSPFLIGIDQYVRLRLNSGTDILPKGMQCNLKIQMLEGGNTAAGALKVPNGQAQFDYRSVDVGLKQDEQILESFQLDRQVEPFETYELRLKLCSSYNRPLVVNIRSSPAMQANKMTSRFSSWREFNLIVSWSATNDHNSSTASKTNVQANYIFSMLEPFTIIARLNLSFQRTFFQLQLHTAKAISQPIYFGPPMLTASGRSSGHEPKITPLVANNEATTTLCLASQVTQQFVWQLGLEKPDETIHSLLLTLNYANSPKELEDEVARVVKYDVRILFDCQTKYLIRESIEMTLMVPSSSNDTGGGGVPKNGELLRVGQVCRLKATIERVLQNESGVPGNEDESIMYELVCDSDIWSVVSTAAKPSAATLSVPGASMLGAVHKTRSSETLNNNSNMETSTEGGNNHHRSQVIKLSTQKGGNNTFATMFEVVPLKSGFLPLPIIRLARYVSTATTSNSSSSRATPLSGSTEDLAQPLPAASSAASTTTTSAIENFSARLLGESLSAKMLRSSGAANHGRGQPPSGGAAAAAGGNNNHSVQHSKLIPFESGQVYNFGRNKQVFVLPSTTMLQS